MRFKPFNIIPSIILGYVPRNEDRNIAIVKSPSCMVCRDGEGGILPDFTPVIYNEACKEWQCVDCWHDNNTEKLSDAMFEKIEESVDGINKTNIIRNSWKYNVEVYKNSAPWMG